MLDMHERGYIIVTDTIPADGQCDVSDAIQKLIDDNPNRTIYFPDGLYRLDKPICTPAHPEKSVDLQLSNYAVLQAGENWDSDEALVRLGAIHPANDIRTIGSNYSFTGGIVDGLNKAAGISIDGGTLYCTHQPCSVCTRMIINAGIHRVVYENGYPDDFSLELFHQAGIPLEKYDPETGGTIPC